MGVTFLILGIISMIFGGELMKSFNLGILEVPYFGICITVGVMVSGIIGYHLLEKFKLNTDNLFLLFTYVGTLGIVGAKILYLILNIKAVEWNRLLEYKYVEQLLGGGFVFYGGFLGGIIGLLLAKKIHNINILEYMTILIPCVPIAHAFGRIGCALASCCYGIPYSGAFHVIYHAPAFAPIEQPLFPVQLLEAFINFGIAAILIFFILKKGKSIMNILLYLYSYSISRFFLEYLRYDSSERKIFGVFSTSQWISIGILVLVTGFAVRENSRKQ